MTRLKRRLSWWIAVLALGAAVAARSGATVLTSESFTLQSGPGFGAAFLDEVVNTSSGLATWGQKGAAGLQGNQSIFPSGATYVTQPSSVVAMKFNIASVVNTLNTTYGAGNWTIANPKLTMQYTYYANNSVLGGGAGGFKTYVVQNNSWQFSNIGSGSAGMFNGYQSGTDPIYATDATTLATWSGGQADLGNTAYNWLSPPGVNVGPSTTNPNYSGWSTDKSGQNQGLLSANLALDPLLVGDVTSASAANPNVSFYMMPNDNTLGLTIFTGGGTSVPTFGFDVVSAPEPTCGAALLTACSFLLRRRRR
jgi:hypothetical protein